MASMISSYSTTNNYQYMTANNDSSINCRKSYQLQTEPQLTNSIDSYKVKIMEKDKQIFEYSKTQKENEKAIETLRRSLELKEEENQKLNLQLQDLSFQLKQYENLIEKSSEDIKTVHKTYEEKIKELCDERDSLIKNKEQLEKVLSNQENNIKNSYVEYQNIQKENNELKEALEEKKEILVKYENIFEQLKKDNKQIPSLKRQLVDMDNVFAQYKKELIALKEQNEKLQFERDDCENKLKLTISEQQKEKMNSQNLFKINYELENIKKDNAVKEKENAALQDKYKLTLKDSDNFVHLVTSELGQFTNFLESLNMSTKTLMKMPLSSIKNFESTGMNSTFSLKFEVIMKTIDLLKSKTIEIINSNLSTINKLNDTIEDEENKNKKTIAERDNIEKDNVLLKHKLDEMESMNKDYKNNMDALNESYAKLKDSYLKLKNTYQDFTAKNEKLSKDTNEFILQLSSKLFVNSAESATSSQIIDEISQIIEENAKLRSSLTEVNERKSQLEAQNEELVAKNSEMLSAIDSSEKNLNEKISNIEIMKDKEIKQQKSILYEKIKSLTQLLEESNHLIQSYEQEVKEHKARIAKLEYNLKMLTDSHIELEKSINNNTTSLQSTIDEKEQRYNALLREIELKDLHIQSLEKLLNQENFSNTVPNVSNAMTINPNQSLVGKIIRTQQPIDNSDQNNNSIFVKNEEHEQELKKLMNCFSSEDNNDINQIPNEVNNEIRTEDINTTNNNNVSEGNNSPQSKKVPGRLYSVKRKI